MGRGLRGTQQLGEFRAASELGQGPFGASRAPMVIADVDPNHHLGMIIVSVPNGAKPVLILLDRLVVSAQFGVRDAPLAANQVLEDIGSVSPVQLPGLVQSVQGGRGVARQPKDLRDQNQRRDLSSSVGGCAGLRQPAFQGPDGLVELPQHAMGLSHREQGGDLAIGVLRDRGRFEAQLGESEQLAQVQAQSRAHGKDGGRERVDEPRVLVDGHRLTSHGDQVVDLIAEPLVGRRR